jgi:hypothetical protein
MLMAPFMSTKWWKLITQIFLIASLIFILTFSKKLDKFYSTFWYWTLKFSNKCDVGIFYVFKVRIIKISFKFYSLGIPLLFFKFVISNFWQFFLLFTIFWIYNFFHFSPKNNYQVKKIQNQKKMFGGGVGCLIKLFNEKFH